MRIESDGHSRGNPRLYELIEHAPKTGKSPTVWAWPELIDYLKEDSLPVAVADPESRQPAEPPSRPEPATAADGASGSVGDPVPDLGPEPVTERESE